MKTYGRIDTGVLLEIIAPATFAEACEMYDPATGAMVEVSVAEEIPISWRYTPELVATLVDITNITPQPQVGDLYDGSAFKAPPTPVVPVNPWAK